MAYLKNGFNLFFWRIHEKNIDDFCYNVIFFTMICVTNQVFAVATSDGDVLHATTPNSTEIGLYPDLNKPIFSANGIPYFQYQNTEKSGEIRNTIDKTSCNELISTYPEHFAFYETNKLSKYECHKYALARLFGYKTMPQ